MLYLFCTYILFSFIKLYAVNNPQKQHLAAKQRKYEHIFLNATNTLNYSLSQVLHQQEVSSVKTVRYVSVVQIQNFTKVKILDDFTKPL